MATVTVEKNTYTVEPLYQWDKNQELVVYGLSMASIPEVHFTNAAMGKAIPRQATMDAAGVIRADVPNSLLQKPYTIQAYICTYEGATFETQYKLDIPVKARNKPEDYTLEDDPEVYSFNALENQVANALVKLDKAADDYKTAETLAKDAETAYREAENKVDADLDEAVTNTVKVATAALNDMYKPRVVSIDLSASGWNVVSLAKNIYSQEVTIEGGTANDIVILQLSSEQHYELSEHGVTYLAVDNDNGTFIVTARTIDLSPAFSMTIQATLEEVKL